MKTPQLRNSATPLTRLVFFFLAIINSYDSQSQNFDWVSGATGNTTSNSITVDQYGNTFIAGGFISGFPEVAFPPNILTPIASQNLQRRLLLDIIRKLVQEI